MKRGQKNRKTKILSDFCIARKKKKNCPKKCPHLKKKKKMLLLFPLVFP
jgi:hypothetical protein